MELNREKLVKTSYFYIADIVEGLDTSLAYARGGFIPNYKTFDELNGKHSQQQGRLFKDGTSDIWTEQWSKFWEQQDKEYGRLAPIDEKREKDITRMLSKVFRKENNVSLLRPEELFRGYKPIIFYRFKIPEMDIMEEELFSMQYYDPESSLEYEIISQEDLGFQTFNWLWEMPLDRLVSFTFSLNGFYENIKILHADRSERASQS